MRIKNWSQFQHFKDRDPIWIKLYRNLLDDIEWHQLEPFAAKMLVNLWLIASEDSGKLPEIRVLAFRLRQQEKDVIKAISQLGHWLEQDDSELISSGYQVDALEKRREEREERAAPESKAHRLPVDWEPSDQLLAFMKKERPDLNPSHVILRFTNYWQAKSGKDATKLDWDKTFQNWVLQEKEGKAKPSSAGLDPFAGRGGV